MLVQKLRVDDLQSEKGYFDGVMVYAQNKVPLQDRKYMYFTTFRDKYCTYLYTFYSTTFI